MWQALDDKELKSESLELLPKVNRDLSNQFLQGGGERIEVPSLIL